MMGNVWDNQARDGKMVWRRSKTIAANGVLSALE